MNGPTIRQSGPGWCAYYDWAYAWAPTREQAADDVEVASVKALQDIDAYEARLAREAEQQALAEYRKIRARA